MSYEEKGVWVYMFSVIATATVYVILLLNQLDGARVTDIDFGPMILWSIGISIALNIVLRILVEILRPSDSYKVDARDKAIARRAGYVNGMVVSIGMIVPLVLAVIDADNFWVANAIYAAFVIAAVVSSIVQIASYRRGF